MNRNVAVILSGRDAGLARTLGAASGVIDVFSRNVENANTRTQKLATASRFAFAALSAAAVIAFGAAVVAAVRFQVEMQNVETVAHAGRNGIRDMGQSVLELSTQLPQTTTTLARGLYDIASSGFRGAQALNILEVSATAASAGLSTTAVASKAVVAVLNAYGLEASEAQDVSDILFQTVELGVLTFEDLATQLGDVIGAAAAAGIEFDEVGSAIATMTLAGLSAAESTVSLNRLIQKLINPGQELAATFRKMGFESGAAALEQEGLHGTMELLREATGGQITELIRLFPEIRAARGAYALMAASGTHYARVQAIITDEQDRAGATQRAFNTQMEAVGNQFRVLLNRVQVFGIEVGTHLLPVLGQGITVVEQFGVRLGDALNRGADVAEPAIEAVGNAVEDLGDLLEVLGQVVSPAARGLASLVGAGVAAGVIAVANAVEMLAGFLADHPGLVRAVALVYGGILLTRIALVVSAFIRLHAGLLLVRVGLAALTAQAVIARLGALAGALSLLATGNIAVGLTALRASMVGIGAAMAALAPTAAMVALVATVYALQTGFDRARQQAQAMIEEIERPFDLTTVDGLRDAADQLENQLATVNEEWEEFGGTGSRVLEGVLEVLSPMENEVLDNAEAFDQLSQEIADLRGQAFLLEHDVVSLANMLGLSEHQIEAWIEELELVTGIERTESLDILAEQIRTAAAAAAAGTPATDAFIGALEQVADPAATATDRVEALDNAIKGLIGTAMSVVDATIGWEQAIDDLTQAVVDNGLNLDINSQEGRNVASAINAAAEAAINHSVAVAEQSGSIAEGVAVLQLHREQLLGQLQDLGLTRAAAEEYINQLGLTPDNISTLVSLENAEAAIVTMEQFEYMLELVNDATSTATVDIDTARFDENALKIAGVLIQIEQAAPEAEVLLNGERFVPTQEMVEAWALHWDSSSPEAEALLNVIDPQNNFATLAEAAQNWDNQSLEATALVNANPAYNSLAQATARLVHWDTSSGTADAYASDQATAVINRIALNLRNLDGQSARVDIYGVYHPPANAPGGGGFRLQRYGGIEKTAQQGLLQAGLVNRPTILFGERATGGEAFIPRFGNPNRSRGVLATAASWYGLELRPQGQGTMMRMIDARTTVNVEVRASGSITDQRSLVGAIRDVVGSELEEHDRRLARELASR